MFHIFAKANQLSLAQ